MQYTIDELISFRIVSNRGTDVDREIAADVLSSILIRKKSLPYNRSRGTRLRDQENVGFNLFKEILITTDIIESIQNYNDSVEGTKFERRVAVLTENEDVIEYIVTNSQTGEFDVRVTYLPFRQLLPQTVSTI